jgi:predicted transcriptional regulator
LRFAGFGGVSALVRDLREALTSSILHPTGAERLRGAAIKERPMNATIQTEPPVRATFKARLAENLMTPNPVSLRDSMTLREASARLVDRCIGGAPVIDEHGRPVGVLSQTDVLIYEREQLPTEKAETTFVRDVMTPAVFAVGRHTTIRRVIEEMCGLNVHRLFVVDGNGVLAGVITSLDVLRQMEIACE